MKKAFLIVSLLLVGLSSFSQSYLGWVTKQVNFREGPGVEYGIISSLEPGRQIFIVSRITEENFYQVVDITTNREGFIHKSYVKIGKPVPRNEQGIFTPEGETDEYDPQIEVYNNTNKVLTLKLNSYQYTFSPKERKTLTITSGKCDYRASAPGVIPYIGSDLIKNNMKYSWQFFISRR